jgi:acid phosphatase family membrane protein YuiD
MIKTMYPFWSAILSAVLAQLLKPIVHYMKTGKWNLWLIKDSGGMPSSHTALVTALALSVGLQEAFSSTIFAVTAALAVILIYDAANVRYYSGQYIKVTQQLVKDVQEELNTEFTDPIYQIKLKDVLGHKWMEVVGGGFLGAFVAIVFHYGL